MSVNSLVFFLVIAIITVGLFGLPRGEAKDSEVSLPPLQAHPLPLTLKNWNDSQNSGDYFSLMESTPVGSLIWSEFPIKVYWDQPNLSGDHSAAKRRFEQWAELVKQAITEWNQYLPLIEIQQEESADIIIKRDNPSLGAKINPETGKLEIPRARSAQTDYKLYIRADNPPILCHRMTIQISPNLSQELILSAVRHELGHALGIWGHSPVETDALYFSQVRNPPPISVRDINTLKKVYEQPTRLGWTMSQGN
nr:peptidase [Gloeothece verrucosa]